MSAVKGFLVGLAFAAVWQIAKRLPDDRRTLRSLVRRSRTRPSRPAARYIDRDVLPEPDPRVHRSGSVADWRGQMQRSRPL